MQGGRRWFFYVRERVEKLVIAVDKVCIKGGETMGLALIHAQKIGETCG